MCACMHVYVMLLNLPTDSGVCCHQPDPGLCSTGLSAHQETGHRLETSESKHWLFRSRKIDVVTIVHTLMSFQRA